MTFGATNPFVKLKELLAPNSPLIATVSAIHSDGTITVQHRGGATERVRAPGSFGVGTSVFVQEGRVVSAAPSLPANTIDLT